MLVIVRVLTFTTLYPSSVAPRHGIFVETRIREIQRQGDFDVRVVAPVPWFPSEAPIFGRFSASARVPRQEVLHGIPVQHPRYLSVPGLSMYLAPVMLPLASMSTIDTLRRGGFPFDLIDAHYFYPDGVAAAVLAKRYRKPLIITARGTDLNVLPDFHYPRQLIRWAANRAQALVTVSAALRERLVDLGVERSRIHVLRNGVDCEVFQPVDRAQARGRLGLGPGPVFVAVGNLVPEKGYDLAIDATAVIAGATLIIVGDGPERSRLVQQAARLGIAYRVRFEPTRPQRDLAVLYSAADALMLPSSREGWPNVVLESIACGTPVIAADVGGVSEIIRDRIAGVVLGERTAGALAVAAMQVLVEPRDREAVRRYARQFSWAETARAYLDLCRDVVSRGDE